MITRTLLQDTETLQLALAVDGSWSDDYPDEALEFMFTDGNYACDCNLALFFAKALEIPEWHQACGSERFRIIALEVDRGDRRYEIAELAT